jgi:hypothetical protein
MKVPLARQAGEPSKLHASDQDRKLGSPNISEVLRRRDIAPKADGAPYGVYIVLWRVGCQHLKADSLPDLAGVPQPQNRRFIRACSRLRRGPYRGFSIVSTAGGTPAGKHCAGVRSRRTAATFLGRSCRSGGRCQFGGICARVMRTLIRPALPEIG